MSEVGHGGQQCKLSGLVPLGRKEAYVYDRTLMLSRGATWTGSHPYHSLPANPLLC